MVVNRYSRDKAVLDAFKKVARKIHPEEKEEKKKEKRGEEMVRRGRAGCPKPGGTPLKLTQRWANSFCIFRVRSVHSIMHQCRAFS